jgi:hypothetical protein
LSGSFRLLPVPQFGPWLRFQSPLVKLDVRITRIQLSPASSDLRARRVGATKRQGVEAEGLVEILVRMVAISGASLSAASHQSALEGLRPVFAGTQLLPQLFQPSPRPVGGDLVERHPIDARGAAVTSAGPVRF